MPLLVFSQFLYPCHDSDDEVMSEGPQHHRSTVGVGAQELPWSLSQQHCSHHPEHHQGMCEPDDHQYLKRTHMDSYSFERSWNYIKTSREPIRTLLGSLWHYTIAQTNNLPLVWHRPTPKCCADRSVYIVWVRNQHCSQFPGSVLPKI